MKRYIKSSADDIFDDTSAYGEIDKAWKFLHAVESAYYQKFPADKLDASPYVNRHGTGHVRIWIDQIDNVDQSDWIDSYEIFKQNLNAWSCEIPLTTSVDQAITELCNLRVHLLAIIK